MKLIDWILSNDQFYDETKFSEKICQLDIISIFYSDVKFFPQKKSNYRNVHIWVLLSDGSAVGMNESPRNGLSFPRIGRKTVSQIMKL